MPEVTARRRGELLSALLGILGAHPEGVQAAEALKLLEKRVTLTPYEQGAYDSGGRRFEKIVRFGSVGLVKAGWLLKQKGRWYATDDGRKALDSYKAPDRFAQEVAQLYRQWQKANPREESSDEGEGEGGELAASVTFEEAEEQAWAEIERYLLAMPPYEFQETVADLLRAIGYHVDWVAPPGKDGGVDILAWTDPLGTRPPRIKVQVKRHAGSIPVGELRSFLAVLGDDDVGLFVATGGFTKDAESEARGQSSRRLTLIDLRRFVDLWIEYYAKLEETARRRLPLRPIHFLAPEE